MNQFVKESCIILFRALELVSERKLYAVTNRMIGRPLRRQVLNLGPVANGRENALCAFDLLSFHRGNVVIRSFQSFCLIKIESNARKERTGGKVALPRFLTKLVNLLVRSPVPIVN